MAAEGISSVSNESDDTHAPPRTLAGATILQIVPALREEPSARAALTVAAVLMMPSTVLEDLHPQVTKFSGL